MASSSILIAVATAGRPAELKRLLDALSTAYSAREDVSLLIVDNDRRETSRPVFDACASSFGGRARYVVEPERGYSSARNAVLRNVADATAIALIDDDEIPAPNWLDRLIEAQLRTGADVVAGPVVSEFPPGAPPSYEASGVFALEAPGFPEGGEMPWCATNNTLMLARVIDLVPGGFDRKFDPMSGEDSHFFLRARLAGCKIVWTHTAVVHEYLPSSRLDRRWIFKRAVRTGNSRALIELELQRSPTVVASRALKTVGLSALGSGSLVVAAARRDRALGLRALHRLGLARGMLLAFRSSVPWTP